MREEHKAEYDARAADKLRYRYPGVGGESYMDIILRLQVAPAIISRIFAE